MRPQLHINVSAPSREKMEPIWQGAWLPEGGLWTSTPNDEKDSLIALLFASMDPSILPGSDIPLLRPSWQQRAGTGESYRCWLLYPSETAKVATINTRQDLVRLGIKYHWVGGYRFISWIPLRVEECWALNFLGIAEDFDALHVTEHAIEELRTEDPRYPGSGWMPEYRLPNWTVESTCWFRWRFSKVEEIGPLANYLKTPVDEFQRAMREPQLSRRLNA